MTMVTRAAAFAAQAHDGMFRRGTKIPYIVHPMEVAAIAAAMTDDEEVISAALLHDVMEDCGVTEEMLRENFSERVARLVKCQTQKMPGNDQETWCIRKQNTIKDLRGCCREAGIVALSDKLSNMRAILRDFHRDGKQLFERFHQTDVRRHAWYYRSCVESLRAQFGQTEFWKELSLLVDTVFEGIDSLPPEIPCPSADGKD